MRPNESDRAFDALRAVNPGAGGTDVDLTAVHARDGVLPPARHRRLRLGVGVTACAVAGTVAVVFFGGTPVTPDTRPAFAGEVVRAAQSGPRLLLDAAGWQVDDVDGLEPGQGYITYRRGAGELLSAGTETLDVSWGQEVFPAVPVPIRDVGQWFRERAVRCAQPVSDERGDGPTRTVLAPDCKIYYRTTGATVLGKAVQIREDRVLQPGEPARSRFSAYLPLDEEPVFVTGSAPSLEQFEQTLGALRPVDVETWLSSLPPRYVLPPERPGIVDEMLRGLPIPPGVEPDALRTEFAAQSRSGVGRAVTGVIACGWLDRWVAAAESGDEATARQAVAAMSTARDWPILREMAHEGGWSNVIWEYADDMAAGHRKALLGSSGTVSTPDGVFRLGPGYATGLGCASERRMKISDEPRIFRPPPGREPVPVDAPTP